MERLDLTLDRFLRAERIDSKGGESPATRRKHVRRAASCERYYGLICKVADAQSPRTSGMPGRGEHTERRTSQASRPRRPCASAARVCLAASRPMAASLTACAARLTRGQQDEDTDGTHRGQGDDGDLLDGLRVAADGVLKSQRRGSLKDLKRTVASSFASWARVAGCTRA